LIARVQHAKALRQKSGSVTSGSSAAASAAAGDAASEAASSDTQQQGDQRQLSTASLTTAVTSSASSADLTAVVEPTRNSLEVTSPKAASKNGKASSVCSTTGSFTTAAAKDSDVDRNSGGSRIHACVVLDPIYSDGRIVGYLAERSFLCPRGESGAVKLVLRDVLGLLKVEGRQVLNLGLAVAHEVKSGEFEFPNIGFKFLGGLACIDVYQLVAPGCLGNINIDRQSLACARSPYQHQHDDLTPAASCEHWHSPSRFKFGSADVVLGRHCYSCLTVSATAVPVPVPAPAQVPTTASTTVPG
jgi:hypothetical protein